MLHGTDDDRAGRHAIDPSFRRPLPRAHLVDREGSRLRRWVPLPIAVNVLVAVGWVLAPPPSAVPSVHATLPAIELWVPRDPDEIACGVTQEPDPVVIRLRVDEQLEAISGALADASTTTIVYLDVESAVTVGAWVRGLDAIRRRVSPETRIAMLLGTRRDEWRQYRAAGL